MRTHNPTSICTPSRRRRFSFLGAAVLATGPLAWGGPPALEFVGGEVNVFGSSAWPGGRDNAFAFFAVLGQGTSGSGSTGSGLPSFPVEATVSFALSIDGPLAPQVDDPVELVVSAAASQSNDCPIPSDCFASVGCQTVSVVFEVRRALCFDQTFFEGGEVFPITGAFSFPGDGDCDSVLAPGLYGLDFQVSSSGQQSASWNLTAWLRYPIESNFDDANSTDGWDVVDLNCNTLNQIGSDALTWFPTGGDPRGHVGAVDPSNQCFFFRAPSRFLGDQSAAAGSTLRFSVRTTADNYLPGSIVILRSGATRLVYDFAHPPVETWTRYAVPLTASAFRVGSAGGPPPSEQVFAAVLANLDGLFIGAEFGTPVFESSFLDRVAWGVPACAGDIDLDGHVDAADLARLLGVWGTSGPDEDLDGDGTVGPADLALVLGGWGDCPQ